MSVAASRWPRRLAFFVLGAVVWLPSLHLVFELGAADRSRVANELVARQVAVWHATSRDDATLRAVNPEWDFMSRTYLVLALANHALTLGPGPEREKLVETMDLVIASTLTEESEHGNAHFLLGYAKARPFVDPEARSVFLDGEILFMLEARELVERRESYHLLAQERAIHIEAAMRRSPTLSAESYPDECWTFCNTTALAALAVLDHVHADDHGALLREWVVKAKARLVDPRTGLLVSSYTRDGRTLDGPEGSSLWMTATNLRFVDESFAQDQYGRARRALGRTAFGFGWAREWPSGDLERPDVDSGPIVPFFGASAGSSGLAVLGASAFGDAKYRDALFASLELAAFPDDRAGSRGGRYLASNRVGDAVVLYALETGPLLRAVKGSPNPREASR